MAVRFQAAIDNSVDAVQNSMDIKVKNAQEEMQRLLDKIMKHKEDMIDVIDTWRYINEKGLRKYFNKNLVYDSTRISMIGVQKTKDDKIFITMQFNNWKKDYDKGELGGGPYDWFVMFDGKDVQIYINDKNEMATVKDMIERVFYDKQADKVIMPIIGVDRTYYTKHDYAKPMKALAFFADHIEDFCTEFFNEAKNITLK